MEKEAAISSAISKGLPYIARIGDGFYPILEVLWSSDEVLVDIGTSQNEIVMIDDIAATFKVSFTLKEVDVL